mmetsp:Transcript_2805/g.6023  ORF Transcript_2805/g.6023 Transcript_2805/m.6023 type:complete len:275 (+) Transcript_2805:375-1199(+)
MLTTMTTKYLLSLVLTGALCTGMPQLAMGQTDATGSFGLDQFRESYNGELKAQYAEFFSTHLPETASAATDDDEINPCDLAGSQTVAEYCANVSNDADSFFVWCKAVLETNQASRYDNRNTEFTIFVPTKDAFVSYYTEVARTHDVPHETLVPILQYHEIEGIIYEPEDLLCKKKYETTTDLIEGGTQAPKVICQRDIAGQPVTFFRGSDRASQKVFTPQFVDPGNPVRCCNANLYQMSNLLLYKGKSANGNGNGNRRNRKNKNKNKNNSDVSV